MNEIYYCKRIYKERDYKIEKGDVGYLEEYQLPEIIARARIFLWDVVYWAEYSNDDGTPYFKNKKDKISLEFDKAQPMIILCKLEEFDKVMELYRSDRLSFKQN